MNKINRLELFNAVKDSWGADTVRKGDEWRKDVPSLNQCCVTALIVQNYLGGDLLRCEMSDGDHHFWNRLPDGSELDWTKEQFNYIFAYPIWETREKRDRKKILSHKSTRGRYEILKTRIESIMKDLEGIYD